MSRNIEKEKKTGDSVASRKAAAFKGRCTPNLFGQKQQTIDDSQIVDLLPMVTKIAQKVDYLFKTSSYDR